MTLDFTEEEIERAFKEWINNDGFPELLAFTERIRKVLSRMSPQIQLLFSIITGEAHIADGVVLAQLMLEERRRNVT